MDLRGKLSAVTGVEVDKIIVHLPKGAGSLRDDALLSAQGIGPASTVFLNFRESCG
jgi:hypothetical protein